MGFGGLFQSLRNRVMGWLASTYIEATNTTSSRYTVRQSGYRLREMMYDGTIYLPQMYGGMLETVFRVDLGRSTAKLRVLPWFNPVPQIVDAYQSIYPGTWGRETKIDEKVSERPVNPKLIPSETNDPIGQIWRMSNMETEKSKLLRWGPNQGTVGIRVVARDDPDPLKKRVWLQFDHSRTITDFEEDSRGNLLRVLLRYDVCKPEYIGDENPETVQVEEIISKDGFSLKIDGAEQLSPEEQQNPLGFCPYVLLRHTDDGERWGAWAYKGAEQRIHGINWAISRQDKSIDRHIFPKWFAAAGGPAPTTINMGEESVSYVSMQPDSPTPIMQPLVADLDQAAAKEFWEQLIDLMREQCPEMLVNSVRMLSGTSGETLAQILKPAEARILAARANYDHAMIRAIQMALSWGIFFGMWDLGDGMGSVQNADKSFLTGKMDFQFADRPAIPQTPWDKIKQVEAKYADRTLGIADAISLQGNLCHKLTLRWAGLTDKEIAENDTELATKDIVPPNPDAVGGTPPASKVAIVQGPTAPVLNA